MTEIRQLQALIALKETGTVSKAAARLHLSQPAFSHLLARWEEDLGTRLFERKTRPLRLSAVGERWLAAAYEVEAVLQGTRAEVTRLKSGAVGELRIAVECHSCFDWLMPSMDSFREAWPLVELDLVSGFQPDPVGLLSENRADVVIVSAVHERKGITFHKLFSYEVLALLAHGHPLASKAFLRAQDFAGETLITYPIPDSRIDVVREVLGPAGIAPPRRATELTVAILQLVASRRGIAAMPGWAVEPYLARAYVAARRIGPRGLKATLHLATRASATDHLYMQDFIARLQAVDPG